jgi:hypothetical protein
VDGTLLNGFVYERNGFGEEKLSFFLILIGNGLLQLLYLCVEYRLIASVDSSPAEAVSPLFKS